VTSTTSPHRSQEEKLVRAIGTAGLAAVIVNITIGAGIFRLPSLVASSLGPAAPLAYVVCAVAMALIVACIAQAGRRVSLTGGPYAYIAVGLGPYAGFLSGVLLWLLGTFASAAVATVFSASLGLLVPMLSSGAAAAAILSAALLFWVAVNIAGVSVGSRLNSIATVTKLFPLLLVAIGGAFFVRAENIAWTPPAAADLARTSLLLVFAFAGVESALVPSGEVSNPERTVPRAIAIAMIGITLLYVLLQVVAQGILGDRLATAGASPLADAAAASFGGWAGSLLLAGASISTVGHMGGMTLSMPRMVYALARDGFLPSTLARVHPTTHAPRVAIIVQSLVTLILALTGGFEKLAILANICGLALYLGCAVAAWRLRSTMLSAVVPWLAGGVIVWLLTSVSRGEWLAFAGCVAAATALYWIRLLSRRQG
jgi:amino acid transporter